MTLGHGTAVRRQPRQEWRNLDAERRLQLVAKAMRPSDGVVDLFPIAL